MEILLEVFSFQRIKFAIIFVLAMIVVQLFNVLKWYLQEKRPSTFFLNKYSFTPKKYFFSYYELELYRLLSELLSKNYPGKYDIFPKVRLFDLADTNYKINRNKIVSKHVDFLVVDQITHCTPILAIELNWTSHETDQMRQRDSFVWEFFKIINIPLLTIHNEELKDIQNVIEKINNNLK